MANPWRIRAEHRAATQFHELGLLISDAFNSSTIVKSSKYLEFQPVARLIPPLRPVLTRCVRQLRFLFGETPPVSMDGVHYYFNQGRPGLSGNYFIANTAESFLRENSRVDGDWTYKSIFSDFTWNISGWIIPFRRTFKWIIFSPTIPFIFFFFFTIV